MSLGGGIRGSQLTITTGSNKTFKFKIHKTHLDLLVAYDQSDVTEELLLPEEVHLVQHLVSLRGVNFIITEQGGLYGLYYNGTGRFIWTSL